VRGGQIAEIAGESLLSGVVEADVPENQRLVLIQRRAQGGNDVRAELGGEVDSAHLGSDSGGDLADIQIDGGADSGHDALSLRGKTQTDTARLTRC
jgi:hypothetical protein